MHAVTSLLFLSPGVCVATRAHFHAAHLINQERVSNAISSSLCLLLSRLRSVRESKRTSQVHASDTLATAAAPATRRLHTFPTAHERETHTHPLAILALAPRELINLQTNERNGPVTTHETARALPAFASPLLGVCHASESANLERVPQDGFFSLG